MSTINRNLSYPISKLNNVTGIDLESLIEISVKEGSNYVSKKTSIKDLGNYIITAHPIFNNLNDLFNTSPGAITFLKPTYFNKRPYVKHMLGDNEEEIYAELANHHEELKDNQLVTLYDVKEYIRKTGIAVQAIGQNSKFKKYINESWVFDDKPQIITDSNYMQPIYSKNGCIGFKPHMLQSGYSGYISDEVVIEKDIMLNVICNLVLRDKYSKLVDNNIKPYYNASITNWLAILVDGGSDADDNEGESILALTTFNEIIKVEDIAIAQVQMSVPIAKDTKIKLFTPVGLNTSNNVKITLENDFRFNRSIFNGINQAHLHFYEENI